MVSTRQLTWTQEAADKAARDMKYMKVVGGGTVKISGARQHFKKYPNDLYLPDQRVVGTREEIRSLFRDRGLSSSELEGMFANAVTARNYTTNPDFLDETRQIKALPKAKKTTVSNYDLSVLSTIADQLTDPKFVPVESKE